MVFLQLPGSDFYIYKTVYFHMSGQILMIASVLIAYMSGRLNRIDQNRIIMIVVGVLFAISIVMMGIIHEEFSWVSFIRSLSLPICWAALCLAYTARFEEHKIAGLEDK